MSVSAEWTRSSFVVVTKKDGDHWLDEIVEETTQLNSSLCAPVSVSSMCNIRNCPSRFEQVDMESLPRDEKL